MGFLSKYRRRLFAIFAVIATAALFWFGNGLNPLWPLVWFAPLPVLLFATRSSWWGAAIAAFVSMLAGGSNLFHYFQMLHMPASVWMITFSTVALLFTAAVLLFRALLRRGAPWSALLAFPALWVSGEYLASFLTSGGTAGSLAYSQLRFLPFLQLASITGPWGMSFLLLLFPAALAVGHYLRETHWKQAWTIVGASVGLIALVLLFGAVRLALPPPPNHNIKVGLIASDVQSNDAVAAEGAPATRLLTEYASVAQALASKGARAIVLPEKLGVAVDPRATDTILQSLANRTGALIVAGFLQVSPPAKYNQARVYAPGAPVRTYNKQHMLPPFESNLTPGTALTLLQGTYGKCGVAICKDMDFTQPARQYGKEGAGLMLVPAWDFGLDRAWHGHIALMRGVENGYTVVRAAKQGYLTVSDNRGRILAETRSDSAPFATLLIHAPATHDSTLYLLLGDWFAWLALAILAFSAVQVMIKTNQREGRIQSAERAVPTSSSIA